MLNYNFFKLRTGRPYKTIMYIIFDLYKDQLSTNHYNYYVQPVAIGCRYTSHNDHIKSK